jgi:hypothetical protein
MKKTTKKAAEINKTTTGMKAAATKRAAPANKATKAAATNQPETKPAGASGAPARKQGSKGATIMDLIQRNGGATAAELQQATGWQPHSVRGFLSTASKKQGLKIASARREDGQRVYSVQA